MLYTVAGFFFSAVKFHNLRALLLLFSSPLESPILRRTGLKVDQVSECAASRQSEQVYKMGRKRTKFF